MNYNMSKKFSKARDKTFHEKLNTAVCGEVMPRSLAAIYRRFENRNFVRIGE